MIKHTELEVEIEGKGKAVGLFFKQVAKNGKAYIYEVKNEERNGYAKGHDTWYEVFEANKVRICLDFEKRLYSDEETKDTYPKDEAFGKWAWTYPNLDLALAKFASL